MTRLQQLEQLAARIATEIDAERSRQVRIAVLGGRLDPVDPCEPSKASPAVIRTWLRREGYDVPATGSLNNSWRTLYAEAGEPLGLGVVIDYRAWARANGIEVPPRGRCSKAVRAAYHAAHEVGAA